MPRYARQIGLTLFATAFDVASADFLAELDMPAFKIASGDLINIPLLKARGAACQTDAGQQGRGARCKRAYDSVMPINRQLCLMQCTAAYPAAFEELNLRVNRTMKGTDHAFSLERPGLRRLVRDPRRARVALGDGVKQSYPGERTPLYKVARKLVAARDLPAGHVLTRADVAIKSPNDGLPPYELDNVIGKVTLRALEGDENLAFADLTDGA